MDMSGIGQHGGKRLPPRSLHRSSFATLLLKPHAAFALLIACIPIRQKMISLLLIQIFYWRLESQKRKPYAPIRKSTIPAVHSNNGITHLAVPFIGRPN
ncbi:hypothetical protein [Janthinobacterium sp.]|uniref:hypothetical protein n=1 Tax=Janthinobacterium sp. TaxID=1871054 RepID=UPI0025BC721F|nr:hypothetical protein [Janthinobacterium sp.]